MKMRDMFCEIQKRLLKQGEPGYGDNGCAYTDARGNHCAVGIMLDDDLLKDITYGHMNEASVGELIEWDARVGEALDIDEFDLDNALEIHAFNEFWSDMQSSHDQAAMKQSHYTTFEFYPVFKENMRMAGVKWDIDECDELQS